jgi:hypothetical protein
MTVLSPIVYDSKGVGFQYDAAGIWVWGKPIEMDIGGVRTSVLFLDTEGFESVGKSNVYDDRQVFSFGCECSCI